MESKNENIEGNVGCYFFCGPFVRVCLLLNCWYCPCYIYFKNNVPLAEISPSDGTFCPGQAVQWTCVSNATLQWRSFPNTFSYDALNSYNLPEEPVGLFRTSVACLRGTEFISIARIPAGDTMATGLNGTRLECTGSGGFSDPEASSIDLIVKGIECLLCASICVAEGMAIMHISIVCRYAPLVYPLLRASVWLIKCPTIGANPLDQIPYIIPCLSWDYRGFG